MATDTVQPHQASPMDEKTARLVSERDSIVQTLPTRTDIFLPTNKIDLDAQIAGLKNVQAIYDDLEAMYGPRIRALRDKYLGRDRAFIIGNGPSLNETDLSCLRDEVTFCVNGFFLKLPEINWTPTFYVVEDHLVAEDRADAINALSGPIKLFPAYLGYCLNRADDTIFYNHRPRKSYPDGFDFSKDADRITYTGCTVTASCLQLAHYMGFRELYLIGVDASYDIPDDAEESADYGTGVIDMKSDDINHFHPDYFGKGYRWHDPQVSKMLGAYAEAEAVTRETGRFIYNATVGGQLEVFERRSFQDIFPHAITPERLRALGDDVSPEDRAVRMQALAAEHRTNTAHADHPKLCIIDMTRMGGVTATGALKETLLGDYPDARMMQVFTMGNSIGVSSAFVAGANGEQRLTDLSRALDYIIDFEPDVILFRPTSESPILTRLAELAYAHTGARFVTWVMDSWQDRLLAAATENETRSGMAADRTIARWFNRSAQRLVIGEAMADAYETRYDGPFTAIANAVDPSDWERVHKVAAPGEPLIVRYSGALAADMGLETLHNVAAAIDELAKTLPVRFQINTRQHFIREQGDAFRSYDHTELSCNEFNAAAYRNWIAEGDVSLIAYNFNDETRTYVRHSMSNKMPECLASGSPLLAVGPSDIATIDYLNRNGVGVTVDTPGVDAITQALRDVLESPERRQALSEQARAFVFKHRSLSETREALMQVLRDAARTSPRDFIPKPSLRRSRIDTADVKPYAGLMRPVTPKDVLSFYSGGKAVLVLALLVLAALPALPVSGWLANLAALGPVAAFALLLFMVGRWIVQLSTAVRPPED